MGILYNKCYLNSNDLVSLFFRIWVVWYFLCLLISGAPGLYIYIYIYIYTHAHVYAPGTHDPKYPDYCAGPYSRLHRKHAHLSALAYLKPPAGGKRCSCRDHRDQEQCGHRADVDSPCGPLFTSYSHDFDFHEVKASL